MKTMQYNNIRKELLKVISKLKEEKTVQEFNDLKHDIILLFGKYNFLFLMAFGDKYKSLQSNWADSSFFNVKDFQNNLKHLVLKIERELYSHSYKQLSWYLDMLQEDQDNFNYAQIDAKELLSIYYNNFIYGFAFRKELQDGDGPIEFTNNFFRKDKFQDNIKELMGRLKECL